MQSFYDRLGSILRDRLDTDEDPFDAWEAHTGKARQAGNARERTPPPHLSEKRKLVPVPPELIEDFRALGVTPGVPPDECKAAWKKLLKIHHPDANAQNPAQQARSTQITKKINASYRRIARWFDTGVVS